MVEKNCKIDPNIGRFENSEVEGKDCLVPTRHCHLKTSTPKKKKKCHSCLRGDTFARVYNFVPGLDRAYLRASTEAPEETLEGLQNVGFLVVWVKPMDILGGPHYM